MPIENNAADGWQPALVDGASRDCVVVIETEFGLKPEDADAGFGADAVPPGWVFDLGFLPASEPRAKNLLWTRWATKPWVYWLGLVGVCCYLLMDGFARLIGLWLVMGLNLFAILSLVHRQSNVSVWRGWLLPEDGRTNWLKVVLDPSGMRIIQGRMNQQFRAYHMLWVPWSEMTEAVVVSDGVCLVGPGGERWTLASAWLAANGLEARDLLATIQPWLSRANEHQGVVGIQSPPWADQALVVAGGALGKVAWVRACLQAIWLKQGQRLHGDFSAGRPIKRADQKALLGLFVFMLCVPGLHLLNQWTGGALGPVVKHTVFVFLAWVFWAVVPVLVLWQWVQVGKAWFPSMRRLKGWDAKAQTKVWLGGQGLWIQTEKSHVWLAWSCVLEAEKVDAGLWVVFDRHAPMLLPRDWFKGQADFEQAVALCKSRRMKACPVCRYLVKSKINLTCVECGHHWGQGEVIKPAGWWGVGVLLGDLFGFGKKK